MIQSGTWIWYFPNGNYALEGEYTGGFPTGYWRSYSEDGLMIYNEEEYGAWVEDELKWWKEDYAGTANPGDMPVIQY